MGAKTLQCEPREPELPAEDRGCRAGGQTHRCDLGPTDAEQDDSHRAQDAAVLGTALFHNNTTAILRFWIQGCPTPGSVPGYVGWDPEQPDQGMTACPWQRGWNLMVSHIPTKFQFWDSMDSNWRSYQSCHSITWCSVCSEASEHHGNVMWEFRTWNSPMHLIPPQWTERDEHDESKMISFHIKSN